MSAPERVRRATHSARETWARASAAWKASRLGRAQARYSAVNGGLLAGGIAYTTLFSLTAALTFAWTLGMALIGSRPALRARVIAAIDQALPGLLRSGGHAGLVDPDAFVLSSPWSVTGIVALVIALLSASRIIASLARAIQLMFGMPPPPQPWVMRLARTVAGVALLGVGVFAAAGLATVVDLLTPNALRAMGLPAAWGTGLAAVASRLAALVVDAGVFVGLVGIVSGVRLPRRDLWMGAATAGIALGIMRRLGTAVVGSAHGPLLATAATFVTLLLWVHLASRVLLGAAALAANPPQPAPARHPDEVHALERPNYVTLSVPRTLAWAYHPVTGEVEPQRDQKAGEAEPTRDQKAGEVEPQRDQKA